VLCASQDFYQLLSPTVSVLHAAAYGELFTLESFTDWEQLQDPKLWIDVKALQGDSSDNIPGIKVCSLAVAHVVLAAQLVRHAQPHYQARSSSY
jgi:5'-3' exonuclease